MRRLIYLGLMVLGVTSAAVVAATYWMLDRHPPEQDLGGDLDVVLVLSSGIDPDGVLSFGTRRRVHTAVWLQKQGIADRLIFSGGSPTSKLTLSVLMKELAVEHGADGPSIEVETASRTTWENLRLSYPMINDAKRIGLLTDATHLPRALVLNEYLGGPKMIPISAFGQFRNNLALRVFEVVREAMAWWYNLGKILAWEVGGWLGYPEEERAKVIF